MTAVRVIVSWMTVLPVDTAAEPDRALAGRAMSCLPVVGILCGLVAAGVAAGLSALGAAPLLAAVLAVAAVVAFTRGMHVDALADTADAFGSYAGRERALEIMRSGTSGPMGIAALVLVILAQVAAVAQLVEARAWVALGGAYLVSRCLPVLLCHRGLPAASPTGFGALIAGTQGRWAVVSAVVVACAAGATLGTVGSAPTLAAALVGAAAAGLLCAATWWLGTHAVRRLGGITGDVLGTTIELGLAGALLAAALLGAAPF